jgi:hypothetical protein
MLLVGDGSKRLALGDASVDGVTVSTEGLKMDIDWEEPEAFAVAWKISKFCSSVGFIAKTIPTICQIQTLRCSREPIFGLNR